MVERASEAIARLRHSYRFSSAAKSRSIRTTAKGRDQIDKETRIITGNYFRAKSVIEEQGRARPAADPSRARCSTPNSPRMVAGGSRSKS